MKLHNSCIIVIIALMCLSSCTYSITQVQTKGTASDVVDDSDTPTANVTATANIPASVLP